MHVTDSLREAGRSLRLRGAARLLDFDEAVASLQAGECMFAPTGPCSGPPRPVGLRRPDDADTILACRAHAGRLAKLRRHREDLDVLHRHLRAQPWD